MVFVPPLLNPRGRLFGVDVFLEVSSSTLQCIECPCIVVMARGVSQGCKFCGPRGRGSCPGAWPCGSYGKGALFLQKSS